jgi:hypothetical protein
VLSGQVLGGQSGRDQDKEDRVWYSSVSHAEVYNDA